jgi:site-specific recombinase XerD
MENQYNFYNLEALFKNFLLAGNKSPVTIKNYLSDLRHFLGWIIFKFKVQSAKCKVSAEPKNISQLITADLVAEYRLYLNENKIPEKTVKRRLSTLAKFCSFCISQGWIKENPIKQLRTTDNELKLPVIDRTLLEYKKIASLEDYNNINDFISFINS